MGTEPACGDIILISEYPGNNQDALIEGDPNEALQEYSPASTFKMIIALAAFEKGIATPETKLTCSDAHLPKRPAELDFQGAMYHSSNQYFYPLIEKLTDKELVDMAARCKFGKVRGPMPADRNDWRFGGPIKINPKDAHVFIMTLAQGKLEVDPKVQGQLIRVMKWDSINEDVKCFGKTGSWDGKYWFNGIAASSRKRRAITVVLSTRGSNRQRSILKFYEKAKQVSTELGL